MKLSKYSEYITATNYLIHSPIHLPLLTQITMSTCGDCDCADKSQCVKKGNSYGVEIIETQEKYYEDAMVGVMAAAEHDGKCKCGAGCTCTSCTCGH